MERDKIINRALQHAFMLLGAAYSNTERFKYYAGGSFDCSSFAFSNYSYGGFPLLNAKGEQLITSNIQVDAVGFDLIYPATKAEIGKKLPSAANLLTTYGAEPGDLIFYNFKADTPRANKITHVAMVWDKDHIIHTANKNEKCCIKPMTYGATNVCAIMRLSKDVAAPTPPTIKQNTTDMLWARVLQIILNVQGMRPDFNCSGEYGPKTDAAVRSFQKQTGLTVDGVVGPKTWAMLFYSTDVETEYKTAIDDIKTIVDKL